MTILFSTIPNNKLVPGHYTENNDSRAAAASLPGVPRRMVIFGHRLTSGASAANAVFRCFNDADADYHAGVGSHLSEMLKAAKYAYPSLELYGCGLAPGAGVAASGVFLITGTATASGTINAYISPYWQGTTLRGKYTISVASGDTPTAMGTALAAAINADPYRTVDAVNTAGSVALTSRVIGIQGNSISIGHSLAAGERLPTTVVVAVTPMASGTVNPTVSTGIANLGDVHYSHCVQPWTDSTSLTAFEAEALRRDGGTIQQEMKLFSAASGSLSTLTTLGDSRNSKYYAIGGVGLDPCPPWIAAAELAARDAAMNHPMVPRRGQPMNCLFGPARGSEFDGDDREALLADGITTFIYDSAGKGYIERLVSTYQRDANGNASAVWRDLGVFGTMFAIRYDWRTYLGATYPASLHAADGTPYAAGLPIVTPTTMVNEFGMRARNEWAVNQGWIEDPDQFLADIQIERNVDGMDMIGVPNMINALHITRTRFDFLR